MASGLDFPTFYDRFEDLRRRLRQHLGWQTVTILAICSLLGFLAVAGLDYRYELPWMQRAIGLGTTSLLGLVLSGWLLVAGLRSWTRYRTASAIERRFPELGQRVRTTVEFRGHSPEQLKSVGVAPGLVRALEMEAAVSTLPLPLEHLIPVRRLIALTGLAALIVGFVASTGMWNSDWQTALRRALLADEPFTQLSLLVQDTTVDRGNPVSLSASVQGRPRETVTLLTRPVPPDQTRDSGTGNPRANPEAISSSRSEGDGWSSQSFEVRDAELSAQGELIYESSVSQVTEPFEFQWIAGPVKSPIHRVDVRYPLQIKSVTVEVIPPEYTGLPPSSFRDGNINVLEGSQARFIIELDGVPVSTQAIFTSVAKSKFEEATTERVAPVIDGNTVQFEKTLTADFNWKIEAESAHGLPTAANSFRVRVRQDGPPTVYFEEPGEALDVHSLAEILMRIRARDDFGLTRAGIVFQINNDEEHTLFAEDYLPKPDESNATERITPKTNTALEGVLPLEHFKLIQKDSITYYGFAEDNRPGANQRTETELRFIDIRPFKIVYRMPPSREGDGGGPGEERPRRATFEELIGRQRTALNRTLAMKRSQKQDLGGLDRLMKFEAEIAELTSDLARFLQSQAEQFNIPGLLDNADLLFQAERAMLDSVDSLSVGKYDVAMLQEKDAVRFLVESRDRLEIILQDSDNPAGLSKALSNYFRQQQTKLRNKPKKDKDELEKAADLLAELAQLASKQSLVAGELDSMGATGDSERSPEESTAASETEPGKTGNTGPETEQNTGTPGSEKNAASESNTPPSEEASTASAGRMSREEVSQKQQEIASAAADIQQQLGQMKEATELARRRMAAATELAEAASGALARGNSKEAAKAANEAAEKFGQLLTLAQGLLAEELSDQLQVARDVADDISRQEEAFARSETSSSQPGDPARGAGEQSSPTEKEKLEAIARQAQKRAADGESLADILSNVVKSTSAADQKSIPKVAELLDKGGLSGAIERMQQQPDAIRTGRLQEERKAAEEIADRLGEAAQKLDALQREIIDPKVAELMDLEKKAEKLADGVDDVETKRQSEQWLQAADQFLEELDDADEGGGGPEDELREELKGGGWDSETKRLRGPGNLQTNRGVYKKSLKKIANELRQQVQQLLLTEISSSSDETPPAQYESLVSKYQRALTMGRSGTERRARARTAR